jgi:hypothetical protein
MRLAQRIASPIGGINLVIELEFVILAHFSQGIVFV